MVSCGPDTIAGTEAAADAGTGVGAATADADSFKADDEACAVDSNGT